MKRIRKIANIAGVVVAAMATALAITMLCAPEEERIEIASYVEQIGEEDRQGRQIDWDSLPPEVVAWVEVPGTSIDEPIAQAEPDSPNAFLYRDAMGQGAYGTPYIDSECYIDSRFVMVYGHHMSDGSAFADFASFIDEGYAREHCCIIVYKRGGETLELEVSAVDVVNASRERLVIDQEADWQALLASTDLILREAEPGSQMFAFATCSYQTRNSRTIVFASTTSAAR